MTSGLGLLDNPRISAPRRPLENNLFTLTLLEGRNNGPHDLPGELVKRPRPRSEVPPSPKLSPRQQDLYDALAEEDRKRRDRSLKDEKLAEMYHGSFYAEAQTENPDRFAQAAQSLRELMDKLPKYSNVPVVKKPQSLNWTIKEV